MRRVGGGEQDDHEPAEPDQEPVPEHPAAEEAGHEPAPRGAHHSDYHGVQRADRPDAPQVPALPGAARELLRGDDPLRGRRPDHQAQPAGGGARSRPALPRVPAHRDDAPLLPEAHLLQPQPLHRHGEQAAHVRVPSPYSRLDKLKSDVIVEEIQYVQEKHCELSHQPKYVKKKHMLTQLEDNIAHILV